MINHRTLIGPHLSVLAACRKGAPEHFGNTKPPSRQRLVYLNRDEPLSLDPALVSHEQGSQRHALLVRRSYS